MDELRARVRALPFPVMGLTPQATIEDYESFGMEETSGTGGIAQQSVSITYTMWRNPGDRSDPANLADLDAQTRAALDEVPPWPRPAWLVAGAERFRYPQLWEAVRTSWNRDDNEYTSLTYQLAHHANHILMNQFRDELGFEPGPTPGGPWMVSESAVNPAACLEIDGAHGERVRD